MNNFYTENYNCSFKNQETVKFVSEFDYAN